MILSNETKKLYRDSFGPEETRVFFSHGRLELLGNHTDHQGGLCLVSGVDMGITAAVAANKDGAIRVISEGFAPFMFHLDELEVRKGELGTTISLFKGVLSRMKELGYRIGGFSAAMKSDLPAGSGLSSSAAVEALIVKIVDVLYNEGKMDPLVAAQIGQYAENVFFGKPCGLLDQIGACFGGVCYLDFAAEKGVLVEPLEFKLPVRPVLVNTGGSHANLTDHYAAIPAEMRLVAEKMLGVNVLSQATREDFMRRVGVPYPEVSERAKLRAQHYYDECDRVKAARRAIDENDTFTFLLNVKGSQESSKSLLFNTMVPGQYDHSPQQGVDIANRYLTRGAVRIMGGGFAGSIIAFVYPEDLDGFMKYMASYYGKDNVRALTILEGGAKEI